MWTVARQAIHFPSLSVERATFLVPSRPYTSVPSILRHLPVRTTLIRTAAVTKMVMYKYRKDKCHMFCSRSCQTISNRKERNYYKSFFFAKESMAIVRSRGRLKRPLKKNLARERARDRERKKNQQLYINVAGCLFILLPGARGERIDREATLG